MAHSSLPVCCVRYSEFSSPVPVLSVVPQGTVLGPLMFLLYINDITQGIDSPLRLFADDCFLYRVINSVEDFNRLQGDLDRLSEWANISGNSSLMLANVLLYIAQDPRHHLFVTTYLIITSLKYLIGILTWELLFINRSPGHHTSQILLPKHLEHLIF